MYDSSAPLMAAGGCHVTWTELMDVICTETFLGALGTKERKRRV